MTTTVVSWTTMETRTLQGGSLGDSEEDILWNYSVTNPGQWDIRLVIDPNDIIDEKDEGNNEHYLVVTAVNKEYVAVVPSFAPSIIAVILVGFLVTYLTRRDTE